MIIFDESWKNWKIYSFFIVSKIKNIATLSVLLLTNQIYKLQDIDFHKKNKIDIEIGFRFLGRN